VEWGRGPWRAVLAFLPRGPRVPSYTTDCEGVEGVLFFNPYGEICLTILLENWHESLHVSVLLGCVECMRCRLVAVGLSVCMAQLGGACCGCGVVWCGLC